MDAIILPNILTFEWDEGNSAKSWVKHKVSVKEQEQAFFDKHKKAFKDTEHSQAEERFILFGKTKKGRRLIVAFTLRNEKIRCISARPMNRKEVPIYEKAT
jgi:uncharacterized DUF497 family protein